MSGMGSDSEEESTTSESDSDLSGDESQTDDFVENKRENGGHFGGTAICFLDHIVTTVQDSKTNLVSNCSKNKYPSCHKHCQVI